MKISRELLLPKKTKILGAPVEGCSKDGGFYRGHTCCRCCVLNGAWGTKAVWCSWARTATRPTPTIASPGWTRRLVGWLCSGGPAAMTWPDWTEPLWQCCAAAAAVVGTDAAAAGGWATRAPQTGSCWWSVTKPTRRRTRTATVWRTTIVAVGKKTTDTRRLNFLDLSLSRPTTTVTTNTNVITFY